MLKSRVLYHGIVSVLVWGGSWVWLTECLEIGFWMSLIGILGSELIYAIMKSFEEMF